MLGPFEPTPADEGLALDKRDARVALRQLQALRAANRQPSPIRWMPAPDPLMGRRH